MRGSLINRLGENSKQPEPKVGMGVTIFSYTDRSAGTIVDVHMSGKKFWFTYDKAIRVDQNGMSDCQEYKYEQQPHGQTFEAYLNKKGQWKIRKDGRGLAIGYRQAYHDYSF